MKNVKMTLLADLPTVIVNNIKEQLVRDIRQQVSARVRVVDTQVLSRICLQVDRYAKR